jgi:alpha-galactosidase
MSRIGFGQEELAPFAQPGHWNDPDMLEIGNGGMSDVEYRTHMSLWALLAAPLLAGNDVRDMSAETRNILMNREVIAIDQDPLGRQARRVSKEGDVEVWMRPLSGGAHAVAVFNRGASNASVTVRCQKLQLCGGYKIRDLWAHADRGVFGEADAFAVQGHGVVLMRMSK